MEAALDGNPLPGLHLREGERLLAYLVLKYGEEVPYRMIAQLFWPAEAHLNIGLQGQYPNTRQAMRSLRQALGTEAQRLVSPAKGVIRMELTGADVDVTAFDRLVGGSDVVSWQEAFALYRGPLLASWSEPWVAEARTRRKRSFDRLLRRLIMHAQTEGNAAQVVTYQRAAVNSTPEDETLWRDLMRTLAQQECYDTIEEEYERLSDLLAARGKRPDAETEALIADLRKMALTAPVVRSESAGVSAPAGGPTAPVAELVRQPISDGPEDTKSGTEENRLLEAADAPDRPQVALLYKRNAQPDEYVLLLLERELKAAGYRVFIDRHIAVGVQWVQEIEQQLGLSEAIVVLLSPASMNSEMLEYEIEMTDRMAQTQGGRPRLLPVRVAYDGPLPERSALASILNPLQYTLWQSEADDAQLISEILSALQNSPPARPERVRLEPSGGAVALDSPFYIERPVDADFKAAIARSDAIVLLKGSRQMGKTSLLARGLQAARKSGAKVIQTDFQALNVNQLASVDAFLFALATAVAIQLDQDPPASSSWNPAFGPNMNMELFLRRKVFAAFAEPLVWGIDEADRLFATGFANEVFGLFRSWYNLRSLDPTGPWSRLTLAIAYSTEAHLLITDPNQSPFNVGTRLTLEDFTVEQTAELNWRYGRPLHDADEDRRFHRLVGGQPYLVRRGLDEMTLHEWDLAAIEVFAASRDDRFLATIQGKQNSGAIWDVQTGKRLCSIGSGLFAYDEIPNPNAEAGLQNAPIDFSPDGRHVVIVYQDTPCIVEDMMTALQLFALQKLHHASFSPDGRQIVTTDKANTPVSVWNAVTGRKIDTIATDIETPMAALFSPDGAHIAVIGVGNDLPKGNIAEVFDTRPGHRSIILKGHTDHILSIGYSPDGRRIVTGSWDNTVKLWDSATGRQTLTLHADIGRVSRAAFSRDGKHIIAVGESNVVKVWDAASDAEASAWDAETQVGTNLH